MQSDAIFLLVTFWCAVTDPPFKLCPFLLYPQVKYLVAMFDIDGDKLVTPAEVLDVLKQMQQVGGGERQSRAGMCWPV